MAATVQLSSGLGEDEEGLVLDAQDYIFEGRIVEAEQVLSSLVHQGCVAEDVFVMLWECQTQLLKDDAALDAALDFGVHKGSSPRQLGMLLISATCCGSASVLNGTVESMCKVEVDDDVFALARAAAADASCEAWAAMDATVSAAAVQVLLGAAADHDKDSAEEVQVLSDEELYNAWRRLCRDAGSGVVAACSTFANTVLQPGSSELGTALVALLLCHLMCRQDALAAWHVIVPKTLHTTRGPTTEAAEAILQADSAECRRLAGLGGHLVSPLLRRRLLLEATGALGAASATTSGDLTVTDLA